MTYRPAIPAAMKREVWERDGGRCVDCGETEGLEYEHDIPFAFRREHIAKEIVLRCGICHAAKTKADRKTIAKTARIRAKHNGTKTPRKWSRNIQSRGFNRRWKRKLNGTTVAR